MGKIFKISGFLVDKDDYFLDAKEVENSLSLDRRNGFMFTLDEDLFFRRLVVEEASVHRAHEDDFDDIGVDLAKCNEYFPLNDSEWTFTRPIPAVGEKWKHFKGMTVDIVVLARHSENPNAWFVVYNCTNGAHVRPLDMFMSEVDRKKYPTARQDYRFEKVEE